MAVKVKNIINEDGLPVFNTQQNSDSISKNEDGLPVFQKKNSSQDASTGSPSTPVDSNQPSQSISPVQSTLPLQSGSNAAYDPFDITNIVSKPTFQNLDPVEKKTYNAQLPGLTTPEKSEAVVKGIVDQRKNPGVRITNAKSFLSDDLDQNSHLFQDTPYPEKFKQQVIDGDGNDSNINVARYYQQRNTEIQNQIKDLKNQQYIDAGPVAVPADNFDLLQAKIDDLSNYQASFNKYANVLNADQAVKQTPPPALDNISTRKEYNRQIGLQVQKVNSPLDAEIKNKNIQSGADNNRTSELVDTENYRLESDGLNARQFSLNADLSLGNITQDQYNAGTNDISNQQSQLFNLHPGARKVAQSQALGQIIQQNRAERDKKSTAGIAVTPGALWENVVNYGITDSEITAAGKQLGLSDEDIKTQINNSDDIPGTSFLGNVYNKFIVHSGEDLIAPIESLVTKGRLRTDAEVEAEKYTKDQKFQFNAAQQPFQPDSITDTAKTKVVNGKNVQNDDYLQQVANPDAGQHNWGYGTLNNVGDAIATLGQLWLATESTGGLGDVALGSTIGADVVGVSRTAGSLSEVAGFSAAQKSLFGNVAGMMLTGYNDNKAAAKQFIGEDQGGENAQNLYALTRSMETGLLFGMGFSPQTLVAKSLGRAGDEAAAKKFADLIPDGIDNLSEKSWGDYLKDNMIVRIGADALKENTKATLMMSVDQAVGIAQQAMFNPQQSDAKNLGHDILSSGINNFLTFAPISFFGAGISALGNPHLDQSTLEKEALYRMGKDPLQYADYVNQQVASGNLLQGQADQRIQLVNTMADIQKGVPADLSRSEKIEFANNLLFEKKYLNDANLLSSKPLIERKLAQVEQLRARQDEILKNSTGIEKDANGNPIIKTTQPIKNETVQTTDNTGSPSESGGNTGTESKITGDNNPQTQNAEGVAGIIQKAIDDKVLTGINAETAKGALSSEENQNQFLKEISDQAFNRIAPDVTSDENAHAAAIKSYGADLVNLATDKFPASKEEVAQNQESTIRVGELIDQPVVYNGQKGTLYKDGKTVVFKVDGQPKEYELGNIDKIAGSSIKDFGIEQEKSVVSANDAGDITVRNESFKNNFSDPLQAINHDKEGNVVSVNLETADGKKRTFRGNIAEDVAYQIHLKEITKDNESRSQFEDYINTDAAAEKEINNAAVSDAAKEKTNPDNAEISREQIQKIDSSPFKNTSNENDQVAKVSTERIGSNAIDQGAETQKSSNPEGENQISERSNEKLVNQKDIVTGSKTAGTISSNEQPAEERTDKEHAEFIRKSFSDVFTKKGVPEDQIDAAIAIMEARANASGMGDAWYRKIDSIGNGEFKEGTHRLSQVDAYHGAPHDFDKFTTDKIGTGEGAQAFGWGMYFTDSENIAKQYAQGKYETQNENLPLFADRAIWETKSKDRDTILEKLAEYDKDDRLNNAAVKKAIDRIKSMSQNELDKLNAGDKKARFLYEVSLHKGKTPDQYDWLNWNKPVTENQLSKLKNQFDKERISEPQDYATGTKNGEQIYKILKSALGSDKEASLFLLRAGIDGVKYPSESLSKGLLPSKEGFNHVVFDENAVSINNKIRFQDTKGALETLQDGKKIIHALNAPDFSTSIHEIAHIFEDEISADDKNIIKDWAKTKDWNSDTSEVFARGFEKYLYDGNAPTAELKNVFEKAKEWLRTIYKKLKGSAIDKEISPTVKKVFDDLFISKYRQAGVPTDSSADADPTPGIGISKQAVLDQYQKSFEKSTIGWNDVTKNAIERLQSDATDKNTSVAAEAAFQVDRMSKEIDDNRLSVSEDRITTATLHLINVEENIDNIQQRTATGPDEHAALAIELEHAIEEREKTLKVIDALGTKAGRNLGLFAGSFSKIDDGGLKVARIRMQGSFGMPIPESVAALDADKIMSPYQKQKVRQFVEQLEKIKTDYDKAIADLKAKKELVKPKTTEQKTTKKITTSIRDLANKVRNSETLDKLGLGEAKGGEGTNLQGFSFNVKEKLADALEFIADGIEKGEGILKLMKYAAAKYKGENDQDAFHNLIKSAIDKSNTPKTNEDRLAEAKDKVNKSIKFIQDQIAAKERKLKEDEKPLNEDRELQVLKDNEKSLKGLLDKYLPQEKKPFESEKQRERAKDKLYSDISDLNDQIANKKKKTVTGKDQFLNDAELNQLRDIRKTKQEVVDELDPEGVDKRKLKSALDSTERQVSEYERKKRLGILPKEKRDLPENDSLKKLREKRDKAKKDYQTFVETGVAPKEQSAGFDVEQDAVDADIMRQKRKTEGELLELSRQAEDANRKWYSKALDWRRSFLVGGIKTLGRVALSGVSKYIIDPLVKQTTGRITSLLPGLREEKVSLDNAKEGLQSFIKFKDNKTALDFVNQKKNEFKIATDTFNKATEKLSELEKKHGGVNSNEYQKFNLEDYRKAKQQYQQAELEYGKSAIYQWINGNGFKDTVDLVKYGSTDFEQSMGGYGKINTQLLKGSDKALYYLETLNRTHAALKNPSARRSLVESYNSKMDAYQDQGIPLTASTRLRAIDMAYGEFLSGKYQNKNQLVDVVNEFKNWSKQENASTVKKAFGVFARVALPVAKIGVNIVKTGIDMSTVGAEGVWRYVQETNKGIKLNAEQGKEYNSIYDKIIAGAEQIPEKDKVYINKVLSKGLFGIALMATTAAMLANGQIQYGGEYDEAHKAKRKYKDANGKWQTLDYGQWVIGGHEFGKFASSLLNHLPEFLPVAMVVNSHNVYQYEHEYRGTRRSTKDVSESFWEAVKSDANEVSERLPYKNLLQPVQLAQSLISLPIAKDISEFFDTDKSGNLVDRKPKGFVQNVENNIGARELIPVYKHKK